MKSAYELAMERMGGGPLRKLSEEEKKAIAEIDSKYKAKIAQVELSLDEKILKNPDKELEVRRQLADEITSYREKCEREKEKLREKKG